jgi:hypothetical protein
MFAFSFLAAAKQKGADHSAPFLVAGPAFQQVVTAA